MNCVQLMYGLGALRHPLSAVSISLSHDLRVYVCVCAFCVLVIIHKSHLYVYQTFVCAMNATRWMGNYNWWPCCCFVTFESGVHVWVCWNFKHTFANERASLYNRRSMCACACACVCMCVIVNISNFNGINNDGQISNLHIVCWCLLLHLRLYLLLIYIFGVWIFQFNRNRIYRCIEQ